MLRGCFPCVHIPVCFYLLLLVVVAVCCTELLFTLNCLFVFLLIRVFTERVNTLSALDAEYITGIPDLYANIDRQFHVNVPCRSKFSRAHECSGPATVVFRVQCINYATAALMHTLSICYVHCISGVIKKKYKRCDTCTCMHVALLLNKLKVVNLTMCILCAVFISNVEFVLFIIIVFVCLCVCSSRR